MINDLIFKARHKLRRILGIKTDDELEWESEHLGQEIKPITTEDITNEFINFFFWHRAYDNTYHPHKKEFSGDEIKRIREMISFRMAVYQLTRVK